MKSDQNYHFTFGIDLGVLSLLLVVVADFLFLLVGVFAAVTAGVEGLPTVDVFRSDNVTSSCTSNNQ
jgi:hypothetical protein